MSTQKEPLHCVNCNGELQGPREMTLGTIKPTPEDEWQRPLLANLYVCSKCQLIHLFRTPLP